MRPEDQLKAATIQTVAPTQDVVRDQDKIMLVLAYLGILSLIPLLTVKDSEYVKWHAKQGLTLAVSSVIFVIVINMIPILGQIVGCFTVLGLIVVTVMSIVKALAGQRWRIPLIADLSERF